MNKRAPKFARRELAKAIYASRGNVLGVARLLDISPHTVRRWSVRLSLVEYLERTRATRGVGFAARAWWIPLDRMNALRAEAGLQPVAKRKKPR